MNLTPTTPSYEQKETSVLNHYCLNLLNMEYESWVLDIEYDEGYKWVNAINQFAEICTCFKDFLYQKWGKYA